MAPLPHSTKLLSFLIMMQNFILLLFQAGWRAHQGLSADRVVAATTTSPKSLRRYFLPIPSSGLTTVIWV